MKTVFCLILLFAVSALAFEDDDISLRNNFGQFSKWMVEHGKTYNSEKEFMKRYTVWRNNARFIDSHNSQNKSFTVAMNKFGDLTNTEFNTLYNGLRLTTLPPLSLVKVSLRPDIPASVDWRTKGVVTPVKDQGQCGSCWAFSTTGSVEGQHALATNSLVSLSEQNLVDCSGAQGNEGCNGGLMDWAFQYIITNKGIDTEASYPYTAQDGTCAYKATNCATTITGFKDVPTGDENALTNSIATVGPISVAIDASHSSFQFYSSGVYYEPSCSATSLDHGVLAVGYGTDGSTPYYIVKNSWASSWGMNGYIWMSRNKSNNCGIATAASYPTGAGNC